MENINTVKVCVESVCSTTHERVISQENVTTFEDFVRLRAAIVSNYTTVNLNGLAVVIRGEMQLFMFNNEKDVFAFLHGNITEEKLLKCLQA